MSKDALLGGSMSASVCEYVYSTCDCVLSAWEDLFVSVHVCGACKAKRGGDDVEGRGMRRAARLKESSLRSRLLCLSEGPSPAVLLVDDHVHFPGSVFCDPPMRHQQTDTCREGGMKKLINTQQEMHTHLPGCQVSLLKVTAREVMAPEIWWGKQIPTALWINAASSLFLTQTHTYTIFYCMINTANLQCSR